MKALWKRAAVFKLAIFIGILFSINSLALSCIASFTGVDWSQLSKTQHFTIICTVIATWTNTVLAFLNKTLSRIEQGKKAISTGDTAPPFQT